MPSQQAVRVLALRDKPSNAIWAALDALAPPISVLAGQDAAYEVVKDWGSRSLQAEQGLVPDPTA